MTTPSREAQIRERCEKATKGPWMSGKPLPGIPRFIVGECCGTFIYPLTNEPCHGTAASDDADFIAHAREDIPWLLDQLASARAEGAAEASKRLVRLQQDVAHVLDEPVFARHVKLLQAALDRSRDERSGRRTATA